MPEDCKTVVHHIRPYIGFGGSSRTAVDWAGVLGLAERDVSRVELVLDDGSTVKLPLRPWPRSDWLSFEYGIHSRPFPKEALAYNSAGKLLAKTGLIAYINPECPLAETCQLGEGESVNDPWASLEDTGFASPNLLLRSNDAHASKRLIEADPRLRAILSGRAAPLREMCAWPNCHWSRLLGTWSRLRLVRPATIQSTWPFVELSPDGLSYEGHTIFARVVNVRSLFVLVDVRRNRVVAIDPEREDWLPTYSSQRIQDAAWYGSSPYADGSDC